MSLLVEVRLRVIAAFMINVAREKPSRCSKEAAIRELDKELHLKCLITRLGLKTTFLKVYLKLCHRSEGEV